MTGISRGLAPSFDESKVDSFDQNSREAAGIDARTGESREFE